jgi:PKHD-type hydroxylase
MERKFTSEIDLSEPAKFYNMKTFDYWNLVEDSAEDYRYIDNAFTVDECKEIIKLGKNFKMKESVTGDGNGFSEIRKSYNSWLPPCELTNWLYIKIQDYITQTNKFFEFDLKFIENFQFTEYSDTFEGMYVKHLDKFPNAKTYGHHRKLSISIQLSDPTSYEGGELLIYNENKPLVARKGIGTMNFFPSYLLHEVTPVTKGKRYALVAWVNGPKFK